jgi:hypothetical protein
VIPKYKFSLASLISHEKDDEESTATVARVEALLNQNVKPINDGFHVADADGTGSRDVKMDGGTLASVVGDQEDGEIKVLHAMKRTEATKRDQAWYFFETERQVTPSSFPSHALSGTAWHSSLKGCVTLEPSPGIASNLVLCRSIESTAHISLRVRCRDNMPRMHTT